MAEIWLRDDGDDSPERVASSKPFPVRDVAHQFNASGAHLVAPAARRSAGIVHRSAIAAVDKLAVPGTLTLSAITEAGSNLTNVATTAAVSAFNRWGPTGPGTIPGTITPTANQAVRIAFAQVTGADGYDVFLGIGGAALWVGRITEAQRATGDRIISTVATVTARGGATVAGTVDVGIVGTGLSYTVAPFASNNAYTPAGVTAINCAGFSRAHILAQLIPTDLRSLPGLTLVPFLANQVSAADWHQGASMVLSVLAGDGQALEQDWKIDVDGATGLVVLVSSLTGQAPAANVWVELA